MEDDDYLRDLMRGGGSDTDDESEDGRPAPGASARGGGIDVRAGAFAALALGGVHGSESSESESESESDADSDADSDVEGGDAEGSGSGPEDTAENGWTWSTGAAPGATLARGATAKKKKPILMPGEKLSLKKRHMAELRAARAEARNGWTPEDVERELESMVAAGRREWTPPGGGVRAADAKIIARLARCYPNLRCDSQTSAASGRKKRAYVTVVNLAHPYHGGAEVDAERGAVSGRGRALGGGGTAAAATATTSSSLADGEIHPAAAEATRAAKIAAPVPTREEFLADPVRLARLARFLGRGRVEGTAKSSGSSRGGRTGSDSRGGAGRGGVDTAVHRTRGPLARRAPVFNSAGVVDGIGDGGVARAEEEEEVGEATEATEDGEQRTARHPSSYAADFGAFEAHTTGFGSRLMRRMGYVEGGGLGPEGRGISEPVSQSLRPKNLGLGATGAG